MNSVADIPPIRELSQCAKCGNAHYLMSIGIPLSNVHYERFTEEIPATEPREIDPQFAGPLYVFAPLAGYQLDPGYPST